ncbi:hypothetical protein [Parashewanella tropica]|uniref:hypothetical protein n=1 Tax=Parashewanella tropica TaxID=2547970 RepID=UPI001059B705|nr:hypothetical protein [Parashewanella tropica]
MINSLLLLTLSVTGADFEVESLITRQSGFFKVQAVENGARVMLLNPNAKPAIEQACRRALTLPTVQQLKRKLKSELELSLHNNNGDTKHRLLTFDIPDSVHYINASIDDYQQQKQSSWWYCQGTVKVSSESETLAGLAIRYAWDIVNTERDINTKKLKLKSVLPYAINHPSTHHDAISLIVHNAAKDKQLAYIQKYHLQPEKLKLAKSKQVVSNALLNHNQLKQAYEYVAECDSLNCRKLKLSIEQKLEQQEQQTADDLDSYFRE